MTTMTSQQIQQMFEDLGLGTEKDREHFRQLANFGEQEKSMISFIRLNDSCLPPQEEKNAKLASTA